MIKGDTTIDQAIPADIVRLKDVGI